MKASAHIGSGSVWLTFIRGEDPAVHGVYGEWPWQSETMSLKNLLAFGPTLKDIYARDMHTLITKLLETADHLEPAIASP